MNNIQVPGIGTGITRNDISRAVLLNHLNSFLRNDLETLMSDFTNESVLITHDASYRGLEEIKGFYASLMPHFPKQMSTLELEKTVIHDNLVYIVWHGKSPSLEVSFATDTFIIKNGKIHRQTFAGQLKPAG
jgi:hypothetical protein